MKLLPQELHAIAPGLYPPAIPAQKKVKARRVNGYRPHELSYVHTMRQAGVKDLVELSERLNHINKILGAPLRSTQSVKNMNKKGYRDQVWSN